MENLKVIENELVPVYETGTGQKVVYGSELHSVLGIKTSYKDWSERRLHDIDAVEKEDFEVLLKNERNSNGGRPSKEHIIKLDTAKEMAMLERNDKGKQVRRYFIQIEKKYKESQIPTSPSGQIHLLAQGYVELEQKVDTVEKKVEHLEYDIPLYGSEADELCNHVKRKGVEMLGGKKSNAYKDTKLRSAVYTDIYNQIKREFGLHDDNGRYKSYKALKRRYIYDAHELIDAYELPVYLTERVHDTNSQMNMEVA